MEHSTEKSDDRRDGHRQQEVEVSPSLSCLLTLPLGESVSTFSLEKAVCSHGLFMMAPNQWDPSTKTFQRPLRLSDETTAILVRISHPPIPLLSMSAFSAPLPSLPTINEFCSGNPNAAIIGQ
ncbi:PREDICTED: uncharacterized protein LOC104597156 [Nelumbo nucifera]|uniref:Uncharacterized protein LOC104597156 n=1 Tax=Nelumbo nucifera TaxID=4432 RepID=A0A1U7ZRL0_NELNU|nr:PREDICTED: uncharacterized protein LOC104597156 [Nelumbo nucifera]